MAQRSESQRIGSLGQNLVRVMISKNGSWIPRFQDEDFGIDLEAELADPESQGEILKIQVKSTEMPDITPQGIRVVVEKKYFQLASSFRVPLVLVVADVVNECAWYLWLQGWLITQRRIGRTSELTGKTATLYIPTTDTLTAGLERPLKLIARCADERQMVLSLIDTMRTAVWTCNERVLLSLATLIDSVDSAFKDFPLELLIDIIVELSIRPRAAWELSILGRFLAIIANNHGDKITKTNVMRMVIPGDGASRAGLNGLGALYDTHEEHIRSLGLPIAFESAGFPEVAFYCRLREKYPGVKAMDLAFGKYDYTIDKMTVIIIDKGKFLNKWANRGESVYLDYLVHSEESTRNPC